MFRNRNTPDRSDAWLHVFLAYNKKKAWSGINFPPCFASFPILSNNSSEKIRWELSLHLKKPNISNLLQQQTSRIGKKKIGITIEDEKLDCNDQNRHFFKKKIQNEQKPYSDLNNPQQNHSPKCEKNGVTVTK